MLSQLSALVEILVAKIASLLGFDLFFALLRDQGLAQSQLLTSVVLHSFLKKYFSAANNTLCFLIITLKYRFHSENVRWILCSALTKRFADIVLQVYFLDLLMAFTVLDQFREHERQLELSERLIRCRAHDGPSRRRVIMLNIEEIQKGHI